MIISGKPYLYFTSKGFYATLPLTGKNTFLRGEYHQTFARGPKELPVDIMEI